MYNPNDPRQKQIYSAGYRDGVTAARQENQSMSMQLRDAMGRIEQERESMQSRFNQLAGSQRKQITELFEQQKLALQNFSKVADALKMFVAGREELDPGVVRIEDIPGRRVPFTLLVDIPVGPDTTAVREQSVTISQEGPFVATRRMATFQSLYQYSVTNELTGNVARLAGRSFGRFRPIHSATDVVDSNHASVGDSTGWFLAAAQGPPPAGTPLPTGSLVLPSNMSSFRTMEFDGRVTVIDAGSSFPRQQISVPTAFWTQYMNSPFDLSALDFFERGSVITFQVQPTHVNNPPAGNVDGECIFPVASLAAGQPGFPFTTGQYDIHEGVCTPGGVLQGTSGTVGDYEPSLLDPVSRLPAGILTIGFEGYRIQQGVAPVP